MARKKLERQLVNPFARPNRTTLEVNFGDDEDFPGVWVEMGFAGSVRFLLDVRNYFNVGMDERAALIKRFGDNVLIDWNIADESGQKVKPNGDGLLAQEELLAITLMGEWMEAKTTPDAPLGESSSDTQPKDSGPTNTAR